MLFKSFVFGGLAGLVASSPLHHQHHEHMVEKRDVVTVTNVVSGATPTTANTVAAETAATSASAVSSGSYSSSSSSGSAGASGAKGITYSPYSDDGGCKSSSQISSEIAQLSGFDIIRLYNVDCDQVSAVLQAKTSSQKILAGIWDMSNIESTVESLSSAVTSNGGWDEIYTVSVGNELVNDGEATTSQVEGYVKTARSALKSAGYTGPVVAIDTFIAVINNPDLCDYSDYVAVNAHAFFDGGVTAEEAGKWVLEQIERVSSACGGSKSVFITETGWPSQGETNGVAVPSKSNQEAAISAIKSSCGNDVTLFTAFNDLWKSDGAYDAEKWWGIFSST